MPKKTTTTARKGAKRGPKEERLVITDAKAALDRLLKRPPKRSK